MLPLAQPPRKDDNVFDDWMYRLWKRISSTAGMAWSLIDKTGSNLTDLETRNHADLQNLNTTNYTHLTSAQAADVMYRAVYDTDVDGVVDNAEGVTMVCRNATGTTIPMGSAVYISGATGFRPTISLAQANSEITSSSTIGVTAQAIANNNNGFVTLIGRISPLNTSAFADGDVLWLSPTVAGGITNVKPTSPNHTVFIGYCAYSQNNNGILMININNGWELTELHDVAISSPSNGQVLTYDSTTGLWKNATGGGGSSTPWPSVKTTIDIGETCTIAANYQLIMAHGIANSGTLSNSGELYII